MYVYVGQKRSEVVGSLPSECSEEKIQSVHVHAIQNNVRSTTYTCMMYLVCTLTSCWMWSLITMFLTLSSNWTSEMRDVVAIEMLSTILDTNNRSTCFN